jgi:probable F420-dependent oxidoreductase
MRIGAIFPQLESGVDPSAIRDYVQAVEDLGFSHLLVYDHVLGAGTTSRPNWRGAYDSESVFHEPFVLFGYLAAITRRLELVTGVIILPQRQTALVAKQAAEVDVLSGGRLRLGVGVGWNPIEYRGLNEDFSTRGARIEEQIAAMRALWQSTSLTFEGKWTHIKDAGINPLPVRRNIPIWLGGQAEPVLRRVGRIGDGWFPQMKPDEQARTMLETIHAAAREAGRDPAAIGVEARLSPGQTPQNEWASYAEAWRALGATHLGVNTMSAGCDNLRDHIALLARVKQALGAFAWHGARANG